MKNREYKSRRNKLAKAIGKDGVAIIATADLSTRTNDTDYPFRSDSDFYYLTGFLEPNSLMLLAPGRPEGEFILCVRPKNPLMETWEGHMEGLNGVIKNYDVDQSFDIANIDVVLKDLLYGKEKIFYSSGKNN